MSSLRRPLHGLWSSPSIFVLAVTGATIGLGNIWKFPGLVERYGGGAFLLVYVACLVLLAFPLLVAEIILGRRGRRSAVTTLALVAEEEGRSPIWQWAGWFGTAAALLLVAGYGVIGGWTLAYVFRAATGTFLNLDAFQAAEAFQRFIGDPEKLLAWHTLFIVVTVMVVGRGLRWGLEEAVRWFMPMLLGLLLLLFGYALLRGNFAGAVERVLVPDFSKLSLDAVLVALRHAFFSLSLGFGVVLVFGAYLASGARVIRLSAAIIVLDTLVGVLAALMVYSVLLSHGLGGGWRSGPELVFQHLPQAFGKMADGTWFGTLFFLLLAFAAWTRAVALLEPAVALLVERRGMERGLAASYIGTLVWGLGLVAVFSFNVWQHLRPVREWALFRDSTPLDLLNFVAANILVPLAGLGLAVFVGWRMSSMTARLELGEGWIYRVWLVLIRYVTPPAVLAVLLQTFGYLG